MFETLFLINSENKSVKKSETSDTSRFSDRLFSNKSAVLKQQSTKSLTHDIMQNVVMSL